MKNYSKKMLALVLAALTLQNGITAITAGAAETLSLESEFKTGVFEEMELDLSKEEQVLFKKGEPDNLKPSIINELNMEPIFTLPSSVETGPYAIIITEKKLDFEIKQEFEKNKTKTKEYEELCKQIDIALENGPVLFCIGVTKNDAGKISTILSQDYELEIVRSQGNISVSVTNDKDAYILRYGETVDLGVTVTGGFGTLSYQWYKDGKVIKGATAASYTATEVGKYTCRVTDYIGFKATSKAVNIVSTLSFTKLPEDVYISEGGSGEMNVEISGGLAPYTYQWYKDGVEINDSNSATFTVTSAGNYNCKVTDSLGQEITGRYGTVYIVDDLIISSNLSEMVIMPASGTTLRVTANGGKSPYSYQWYKNDVAINGAKNQSYGALSAGSYYCIVTDNSGQSVKSKTCEVIAKLAITLQPESKTVASGNTAPLAVGMSGGKLPYTYQWYRNGSAISEATERVYYAASSGNYYCLIKDASGQSITTNTAIVTVANAIRITSQTTNYPAITPSGSTKLFVNATGGYGSLSYQWYKDGTAISGATTSTVTATATGRYYCVIKDTLGQSATSSTVTVVNVITITGQTGAYPVLTSGSSVSLSVSATGGYGSLSYQWYKNNSAISGATSKTYSATAAGTYYCRISDSIGQIKYTSNIIVVNKLSISSQSGSVTISEGSSTTLSVNVSGGYGSIKYQWYKDGTAISGATSRTYTTKTAGKYYCKITDQANQNVSSLTKVVTVVSYRITSQPQSGVIASDRGYKLSVAVAGGTAPYKYTWRKDGGYIGNEANLTAYEPGKYYCTIVDANGKTLTSDTATLTKNYLRFTNTFPTYAEREGSYYHLKAGAAGGSGKHYYYYWQKLAAGSNEWVYTDCHDAELYVYAPSAKGDRYRCCITCEYSYEPGYAYLWGPVIYMADPMSLTTKSQFYSTYGYLTVNGKEGFGSYTVKWYKRTAEEKDNYKNATLISSYYTSDISNINYTVYKSKTTSGKYEHTEFYWNSIYDNGFKTYKYSNYDLYTCEITDATGTTVKTSEFYVDIDRFR
ncbi:MAG: hypothetical protein J5723_09045 [Ruminococcus sp.]|nr:hypothetical protein [Ruminococcus sp.]